MKSFTLDGKGILLLCLMAIAAAAFVNATHWPVKAGLFPMLVSGPLFALCFLEFLFNGFEKPEDKGPGGLDFKISEAEDPKLARKRTAWIFVWCFLFFALVLLAGFTIAVPLFVFLYLKPHCKEGWGISLILTGVAWFAFWGLFVWLLSTPLPDGFIQIGLRRLGVL